MLYILIIVAIAATDLLIKNHIERYYWNKRDKKIFGGFINVTKSHNSGGFLNLFEKKTRLVKYVSLSILISVFFIFILLFGKKRMKLIKTGLALILGGAISNEYDRFSKEGVTDYFSFNIPKLNRIVFNLGDMAIFAGIICLLTGSRD